jgi:hypothetical protein
MISPFIIEMPKALNIRNNIRLANMLTQLPESDHYIFDFKNMKYAPPFGLLYISSTIRECRAARPSAKFQAVNFSHNTYAGHMGFYKSFGLNFGKAPGEAGGSSSYLPIRRVAFNYSEDGEENILAIDQEDIERHAHDISKVLARSEGGDLVDTLTYSFREILRNSLEHSMAESVSYCAQYWPTSNTVEIAVMDYGCGLAKSLSYNPYLEINNNRDALNYSLMPGISGKFFKGSRRRNDIWQNSGYGLFITSRLCGNGGSFFIASGDTGVMLKKGERKFIDINIRGTGIRFTLDTSILRPYKESIDTYYSEGRSISKSLHNGEDVTASVASRFLSRDFPGGV